MGDDVFSEGPGITGNDHPDTSWYAAASISKIRGRLCRAVFVHVVALGEHGSTTDEAEVSFDGRHQTISARFNELHNANLIHDSGRRRKTRSGRWAAVYVAGPRPRAAVVTSAVTPVQGVLFG